MSLECGGHSKGWIYPVAGKKSAQNLHWKRLSSMEALEQTQRVCSPTNLTPINIFQRKLSCLPDLTCFSNFFLFGRRMHGKYNNRLQQNFGKAICVHIALRQLVLCLQQAYCTWMENQFPWILHPVGMPFVCPMSSLNHTTKIILIDIHWLLRIFSFFARGYSQLFYWFAIHDSHAEILKCYSHQCEASLGKTTILLRNTNCMLKRSHKLDHLPWVLFIVTWAHKWSTNTCYTSNFLLVFS